MENDLKRLGMQDNVVGSLMVPYGYTVEMFDQDSRSGKKQTVYAEMFRDDRFAMECVNLKDTGYRAKSMTIKNSGSLGGATGYWESITATSKLHYEIVEGFESSHSEHTSVQMQYELSIEMSEKIGFKFANFEDKISESFSEGIQLDIEDTYSHSLTQKISLDCK